MNDIRNFIIFTVMLALIAGPINSQNPPQCTCPTEIEVDEQPTAYYESTCATHWSVYVPIGAIIAAAIWMGIADKHHEEESSIYYHGSTIGTGRSYNTSFTTSSPAGFSH